MKPKYKNKNYTLYLGDCVEVLNKLEENSIDVIVTDPPYEIDFKNKNWDNTGVAFRKKTWEAALRVLKPGGYLLAFSHSRTFHRMAVAIEDSGFDIKDTIMWVYGSGFPKSMNLSIAIDKKLGGNRKVIGKGRSGKTAMFDGTKAKGDWEITEPDTPEAKQWNGWGTALKPAYEPIVMARKPVATTITDNVLIHGVGAINIESGKTKDGRYPANFIHDGLEEEWAKYFYTSKASKKDKDEGVGENIHPTVKPTDLMQYLIRLVAPKGSVILDLFMGSGSTGKAAMIENNEKDSDYHFIGVDITPEYLEVAKSRIEYNIKEEKEKQITMFDLIGEEK